MKTICSKCGSKDISRWGKCRLCEKVRLHNWYITNREHHRTLCRKYEKDNPERISIIAKRSREKNKEKIRERSLKWHLANREREKVYKYERRQSNAGYEYWTTKIKFYESIKPSVNGNLETKCAYCGKWFEPTHMQVRSRYKAILGKVGGECRLYCSTGCKKACPTYGKILYPKGFRRGTAREVVPELRQMVFERDDWECQKCGDKKGPLHCHHINGYAQNKILANDPDNCITLCKACHKVVHSKHGCRYVDLQCNETNLSLYGAQL